MGLSVGTTAWGETFSLVNGDRISGTLVERTNERLVLDHPVLGRLTFHPDQLAKSDTARELAPADPPAPRPEGTKRRIEVGVNGTSGNSRNNHWRLGFRQRNENQKREYLFSTAYQRASNEGEVEENDFFAELTYDWFIPDSQWFRFARGRYDWNEFEDWDSRLSANGGAGYRFYSGNIFDLSGRTGLGTTQTFGGSEDGVEIEALLGADGDWQVNGTQRLEFANTLYFRMEDPGTFRNLTSLSWILKVDRLSGMDLKLGIENEYESRTAGDARANDLKYDFSLVWQIY